jgi:hypothetical protein
MPKNRRTLVAFILGGGVVMVGGFFALVASTMVLYLAWSFSPWLTVGFLLALLGGWFGYRLWRDW